MNSEEDEFKRIEAEALRLWAAQTGDDDDTQGYASEFALPQLREFLNELNDRIARRYRGGAKDQDIAYGMEIVYFDIIDLFEGKK
jgi:predicted HTH domain antitoxin